MAGSELSLSLSKKCVRRAVREFLNL